MENTREKCINKTRKNVNYRLSYKRKKVVQNKKTNVVRTTKSNLTRWWIFLASREFCQLGERKGAKKSA